jgi:ubiquinone/menaquinone biosynthesis C-methylase UbiE
MKKTVNDETLKMWNGSAPGYKEGIAKDLKDKGVSDRWVQKILEYAPHKEKMKILDIGTGPGFFTINFARAGHDVIGIDISPEMVRAANENAEDNDVECVFKLMNANELEFPDDTFDLIINRFVSWTLPDLYDCYKEWRRVLAPNGKIILFDANHYLCHFDKKEAKAARLYMRQHIIDGKPEFTEHFDYHVRYKYWEECIPNIGIERPSFDLGLFNKLRFINYFAISNPFGDEYRDTGTTGKMFMLCAEKPSLDQENDFIVNEYWEAISGAVSARTVKMIRNGKAKEYIDLIAVHISGGSKVLDIGTGSGTVAISLAEMGYNVTGIDRAPAMIDMAKLTAKEMGVNVKWTIADAEELPYKDGKFDAVVLRNVIWNSYRPQNIISEAARVLKKHGVLIISDGNWQADIRRWHENGGDESIFPNYRRRELGLGSADVINHYYDRLPLNKAERPKWDKDTVSKASLNIEVCQQYQDPMVTSELTPVLKPGFLLVARKE